MKHFIYENNNNGLTENEIRQALLKSLEDFNAQKSAGSCMEISRSKSSSRITGAKTL